MLTSFSFLNFAGSSPLYAEGNELIQQLECGRDRAKATMNGDEAEFFSQIVDNSIQAIENGDASNAAIQQEIFVRNVLNQNPEIFTHSIGVIKKADEEDANQQNSDSKAFDPDQPQANVQASYSLVGHLADTDLTQDESFDLAVKQIVANYGAGSVVPTGWWIFSTEKWYEQHQKNIKEFESNTEAIADAGAFEGESATEDFRKASADNAWELEGINYSMYNYGSLLALNPFEQSLHPILDRRGFIVGVAQNIQNTASSSIEEYTAPFMADSSVLNPARFVLWGLPEESDAQEIWNKRFRFDFT